MFTAKDAASAGGVTRLGEFLGAEHRAREPDHDVIRIPTSTVRGSPGLSNPTA